MAEKLTQEQIQKNYGAFVHEGLFLDTVEKLENDIANSGGGGTPTGVVKTVNGKTPNSSGSVTIAGEDIIADKAVPGSSVTEAIQDVAADVSGKAGSVNGKSSIAGAITIDAGDIKTTDGSTTVEISLENKLDKTALGTEMVKEKAWTDMIARIVALEAKP